MLYICLLIISKTIMLNTYRKSLIIRFIVLIFLLTPFFSYSNNENELKKTVVYVSSYNEKNHWAIKCKESMMNKFIENGYSIKLLELYLNEKINPDLKTRTKIVKEYFAKLNEKVDVVIAFDYGATDVFLTYTDSIISKLPIIFVSELEQGRKIDKKHVTGIISEYGVGQVYKTGLRIFPNTNKIYVWADKSPTGAFFMNEAKHILKGYENDGIKVEYGVDANSKEELLLKCRNLEPNSFVIFSTWLVDNRGKRYFANDLYPQIIANTKVPILNVYDGFIGEGFVGGFVQSAKKNAEAAAAKAIRIFNGEIPEKMTIDNIPPTPIFDYAKIIKMGGSPKFLPKNAEPVHMLRAFFMVHTIIIIMFLAILIVLIVVLILRIRNRRLNRKIREKEQHEKELELNIKLLSFAIPSLKTVFSIFDEREKIIQLIFNDDNGEKRTVKYTVLEICEKIIEPSFVDKFVEFYNVLLQVEEHYEFSFEFRGRFSDDEVYLWWEARGIVELIENEKEKYRLMNAIVFNIENFKVTESKLNEALEKSIQNEKLKSNFISNITHEIRTPLNAIIGFTNLVIDSDDKEEQHEYKKIVRENNNNLLDLVNDIIDLSEIETGFLELKRIKFDLKQYFDEIESVFKYKMNEGVDLIVESPHKSCIVYLDKNRLTQIIKELIDNSIKFTEKGYIKIGYEVVDENKIKFYVQDTGEGISDENIHKAFNRFEKLGSYKSGTGLGLSIIKAILDFAGAEYDIESKEGQGTLFWAIVKSQIIIIDDEKAKDTNIEVEYYNSKKTKILVADENMCPMILMDEVLNAKYDIICAKTGVDAIDKTITENPDIILISLMSYDIGGIETIRKIRENSKEVFIIAISEKISVIEKEKAFIAGCNKFVEMPIEKEELLKIIEKVAKEKD
ncbi:MAG: response regulator [Bacteroidetes bacterium]|nr:response regulator [Bacteroidota bacterium]